MPSEPVTWTAGAVTALVGSVFAFTKWLLPFLRTWERERVRRRTEEGIRATQRLYSHLQALEEAGIHRSIVFAGHNGGGTPRPGAPFYVSATHWNFSRGDIWAPEKYQELPVDAAYIRMLVDLIDEGSVHLKVAEMPPSQLRSVYDLEGVTDVLIVFLGVHDKQVLYMSAAVHEGVLTDNQIAEVQLRANAIRQLLSK